MPDYVATLYYVDSYNGETTRAFKGTFADSATAATALAALLVDAQALTDAQIYKTTLAETTLVAGAPSGGSLVFNTVDATVNLTGKADKGNINMPAVIAAAMSGNSLITTAAGLWDNFIANFAAGVGWTISDGDTVASTVSGKRSIVRSGKTNLPK